MYFIKKKKLIINYNYNYFLKLNKLKIKQIKMISTIYNNIAKNKKQSLFSRQGIFNT